MGAQITSGLGQAWSLFTTFVPKLIVFLLILLVGWLIAKAISKAVSFLLQRVGFGRLVERSGLGSMTRGLDPANIIVKLVYYFILLLALQVAFAAFGPTNPVSVFLNQIIGYLPRVVVAVILVLIAAAIGRIVRNLITGALGERPIGPVLGNISFAVVLALGIIAALGQLEIATAVINTVMIFALATLGGVLVVGMGGGLIQPMRQRWDGWLDRLQEQNAGARQVGAGATRPGIQESGQQGACEAYPGHLGATSDAPTPPEGVQGTQRPEEEH